MRLLRPFALAASLLAFSTCSYAQWNFCRDLGNCTDLSVKVVEGVGTAYRLTRDQSEKALNCLARVSDKEDSWIYNGYELIDTGYNERADSVTVDHKFIDEYLLNDGFSGTIYDYHIHPMVNSTSDEISPPSIKDVSFHNMQKNSIDPKGITTVSCEFDGMGRWCYDVVSPELEFDCDATNNMTRTRFGFLSYWYEGILCINELAVSREEKTDLFIEHAAQNDVFLSYKPTE